MSSHSLLYHDIDKANGIGTLSQHHTILSRHKKRSHQMNYIATKDNYVAIENGKTMKQCACDKVLYVVTNISTKDKTKADKTRPGYPPKVLQVVPPSEVPLYNP